LDLQLGLWFGAKQAFSQSSMRVVEEGFLLRDDHTLALVMESMINAMTLLVAKLFVS